MDVDPVPQKGHLKLLQVQSEIVVSFGVADDSIGWDSVVKVVINKFAIDFTISEGLYLEGLVGKV